MTGDGLLHWDLGMRITQDENSITVDQERYAEDILKRFKTEKCNAV